MVSNGAQRANSVAANDALSLPAEVEANTRPFKLTMPTIAGTVADDYPLPRPGVVFFIVLHVNMGFWHAHIGWILFWRHTTNYDNVKDLKRSRLLSHQHDHHAWWSVGAGVVLPMLLAWWIGHPLGGFIVVVCLRIVVVLHSTFFVNSFAHTLGTRPFDPAQSARDNWIGAILTNGEGFHNFHHRFPLDYRNGVRWYHWDPSK